jgi:multiple sugar transport system substrate-binding protein
MAANLCRSFDPDSTLEESMKVRVSALLILVLALTLAACAPTTAPQAPAAPAAPAATTAPAAVATAVPAAPAATTAPAAPAATTVPAAPAATTAPAAAGATGSISADFMASGTYDKAAQEIADKLKAQGLDVKIAAFPWATLRQNNTNDMIAGSGQYDVMSGSYYLADLYSHFASLDDYFKKDNYGANMIPGILDPGKSEWYHGHHIGAPYGIDAYGVLYRTDLFKDAGIDPQFATWQDLAAALPKLKDKLPQGVAPFVFAYGASEQLPAIFFGNYDGYLVNKDGKYQLDPTKAAASMQLMKDMLPFAPSNAMALSIDEANAQFLNGQAAMLIGWPSFVRAAADDPAKGKVAGKWAQLEFPGPGFPWLSLWQLFINNDSKNKDAAWAFIKEYTSEANAVDFLNKYGIGSVYPSTYNDPTVASKHSHDFPVALKNFAKAKNPPLSGEAQDFLASTIGQVLLGQLTPDKAVEQINTKWATITVPDALGEAAKASGLMQQ